MPDPANHEGELEQVTPSGPRNLSVSGWARDLGSATPVQVDIVVNGVTVATVTADRPRPGEPANGFAARIFAPTQPALVCARTVATAPLDGLVLGCRRRPFPVPIRIVAAPGTPPPAGQFASFFWVDSRGDVAKALGSAPIENGVALYDGDPLDEEQLSWAVTVHDPTDRPMFRSGPLPELPGPPDAITPTASIAVYRSHIGANFGLNSGEGAPHLVTERLRRLPSALRVDDVRLGVNNAGQEVVVVQGRLRSFLVSRRFVYTLAVTVRPDSDPGRPADVLVAEPAGPGSSAGASLGAHTEALDRAICEGVKQALEAGCRFVASTQLELADVGFPATIVSVTEVELLPSVSDPSLSAKVHAGANLGGGGGVLDPG